VTANRLAATTTIRRRRALAWLAVFVGLGGAWAAVERYLPAVPVTRLTAGDAPAGAGEPAASGGADGANAPAATGEASDDGEGDAGAAAVPEMSEADMEAQLEAIEAGARQPGVDAGERAAETPLPADLPVSLPSDI
jgi:hypothetical protein